MKELARLRVVSILVPMWRSEMFNRRRPDQVAAITASALSLLALLGAGTACAKGSELSAAVAGGPYTLTVAPVVAKKGVSTVAKVVITPAAGYHMNEQFPVSLKLTPPAAVSVPKPVLKKEDAKASEKELSFEVAMTPGAAGKLTIPGDLRFAVCTESTCDPQKTTVAIVLDVK